MYTKEGDMRTVEQRRYTYEDYAQLPEGAPYELIGGRLVKSPSPRPVHQRVVRRFFLMLEAYVSERQLGEVFFAPLDVRLEDHEAYQPDLFFVSADRAGILDETCIHGAPDLVVEVLSPSTGYYDLTQKKRVYEMHGVQEYWLADPYERTVDVYRNTSKGFEQVAVARQDGEVASALLDGFSVDLKALF